MDVILSRRVLSECAFDMNKKGGKMGEFIRFFFKEKQATLFRPKAEPAGVYSQAVHFQDGALSQRQQAFWQLLAHLL
jgi:hypothetical protein